MGKSDIAVRKLLRDKKRFADLFNGTIFGGKQVINPEELEEKDSEGSVIITDKNNNEKGVQKYRDITMRWKQGVDLSILACENQKKVHYAMPVRMMLYDGLTYTDQICQIWKNREPDTHVTEEEYLSNFRKEDKIYPVISLVFYYGLKEWDGSRDLHGMFHQNGLFGREEILKKYVPNYPLNLIDAGNVEDIEKFQTDLQLIFGMLQFREKREGIKEYIDSHRGYFENVDIETYQAMRELMHSEKQLKPMKELKERKGRVNMCKALEALYEDGVKVGMERGIEAGMERGIEAGMERGIEAGTRQKLCELVEKKLKKGMSATEIADMLEEDETVIAQIVEDIIKVNRGETPIF